MFRSLCIMALALAAIAGSGHAFGEGGAADPASRAQWRELFRRRPFPYLLPQPESRPTGLDGTYVKTVPSGAERVHCRRCPDYAPEGGVWKLSLDRGVFRIFHPASGWKSIGTFIVAGDRLLIANDPNCIDRLGIYAWRLEQGRLGLQALDDPCAIGLRGANIGQMPWQACRPPNTEAAVTGHWPEPEGCE